MGSAYEKEEFSLKHIALPDTRQSVWHLTAIQLGGWMNLPVLATSLLVLAENTFWGAVLTIFVGNALLWFIRVAIVMMSYQKRQSTLDIAREYLGSYGGYCIAVLCLISTLVWFIAQTSNASERLTHLISFHEDGNIDQLIQVSVLLGVISTFLCMEGIVLLRRLTTIVFPVLMICFLAILWLIPTPAYDRGNVTLSLSGLSLVLSTNLGITSDLPTFFRHSKSLKTSIIALAVIQLISLALALGSLHCGAILLHSTQSTLFANNEPLRWSLALFIFLSAICANVANVYSASVGWELLAPASLVGRKEYLILGLGLTTIFILVAHLFSVNFLLNIADSSLVNLCLVLVLGFILRQIKQRPPHLFEQGTYLIAWMVASALNALQFGGLFMVGLSSLFVGFLVIALIFGLSEVLSRRFSR